MHPNAFQRTILVMIESNTDGSTALMPLFVDYNDIRGFMTDDYFRRNLNADSPDAFVSVR